MKKMTLDLEALTVESFVTDAPSGRGTVVGAMKVTQPQTSEIDACPSAWGCTFGATCDNTCADSCLNSCQGSCDLASGCGCSGPIC
jgi:hypothetical protein